jgi:hypothetical protein
MKPLIVEQILIRQLNFGNGDIQPSEATSASSNRPGKSHVKFLKPDSTDRTVPTLSTSRFSYVLTRVFMVYDIVCQNRFTLTVTVVYLNRSVMIRHGLGFNLNHLRAIALY